VCQLMWGKSREEALGTLYDAGQDEDEEAALPRQEELQVMYATPLLILTQPQVEPPTEEELQVMYATPLLILTQPQVEPPTEAPTAAIPIRAPPDEQQLEAAFQSQLAREVHERAAYEAASATASLQRRHGAQPHDPAAALEGFEEVFAAEMQQLEVRRVLASPSELLASPSELLASPSEHLASPSELLASPSELLASPGELSASPSDSVTQKDVSLLFESVAVARLTAFPGC
jgi:hypothetical protein